MADTAFFSPEVFVFLRQLKRHNDREWFAKNKARYQTSTVEPALSFISGFAPYLGGSVHTSSPMRGLPTAPCFASIATFASHLTGVLSKLTSAFTHYRRAPLCGRF